MIMRNFLLVLLGVFLGNGAPVFAADVAKDVVSAGVKASFDELERQMIYKYFGEHKEYVQVQEHEYAHEGGSGKNDKHKKKGLPPGIAKKLERGGTMPPGIAKQVLPVSLEKKLPPPPQGYERTIVGNDVLLVQIDTGRIADIITDAVLGD
jgi:Ni/Co efflux regulator RcnB